MQETSTSTDPAKKTKYNRVTNDATTNYSSEPFDCGSTSWSTPGCLWLVCDVQQY